MLVNDDIRISSALKDYLEAIYSLSRTKASVRITDISIYLGISKPSVNRAVNALKQQGLVTHEPYGDITLTDYGAQIGETLNRRHTMIKKFLMSVLSVPEKEADMESVSLEHSISQNTIDKMKTYMEKKNVQLI